MNSSENLNVSFTEPEAGVGAARESGKDALPPPPAPIRRGRGQSLYKPLAGPRHPGSSFFSEMAGSGTYIDGYVYTSGVSVSGGGGGGMHYGAGSGTKKHVAFGKIGPPPPLRPTAGGRRGGSNALRKTSSVPERQPSRGLPPVVSPWRSSPDLSHGPSGRNSRVGVEGGRSDHALRGGRSSRVVGVARGSKKNISGNSSTRQGKLAPVAAAEPVHSQEEMEMIQLMQDLERLQKSNMSKEERKALYVHVEELEKRYGKLAPDGTLQSLPKIGLTQALEEAARANCPPRDPRLKNLDDLDSSDDEASNVEEEKPIGAHRDSDWRPIVVKASNALKRIDATLAALHEDVGPDPDAIAVAKQGLPKSVPVAADGETPLVFVDEQNIDFSDDDSDEEEKAKKAKARGNLIENLVRDASAQETSAEEKAEILGRMLDAASVQELETARALARMDRLMQAMCISEAEKGAAAATSEQIKRETQLAVVGLSLDDDDISLEDAVTAVRTITVTTGDLSFDMFRSLIAKLAPGKNIQDHVFCSLYLDARQTAGRITSKSFEDAAMTAMEMEA